MCAAKLVTDSRCDMLAGASPVVVSVNLLAGRRPQTSSPCFRVDDLAEAEFPRGLETSRVSVLEILFRPMLQLSTVREDVASLPAWTPKSACESIACVAQ